MVDQVALLANWRTTRSPAVADVLQLVPLDPKWPARLKAIATMGTSRAVQDRLRGLPSDDPRVTVFLIECLAKPRWSGAHAASIWKLNFKRLVELADSRAIAPLRAAAAKPPHFLGARHTAWIVAQLTATADALDAIARTQRPDSATTRALVAAQHATVPPGGWFGAARAAAESSADAILANVWAAPEDDDVRAVAGDALLERGDPWGELIALQLHPRPNRAAVNKLLRKHTARFVGPIAKITRQRDCGFAKGFLTEISITGGGMTGRRMYEEAARAPQWSTVRSVRFTTFLPRWWLASFCQIAALPSLREIKIDGVVIARASGTAAWRIVKAPKRLEAQTAAALDAVVSGMPAKLRP